MVRLGIAVEGTTEELFDFYGFKKKSPNETQNSLESRLLDVVEQPSKRKFIPYIQMYEFEALLLPRSGIHKDAQQVYQNTRSKNSVEGIAATS